MTRERGVGGGAIGRPRAGSASGDEGDVLAVARQIPQVLPRTERSYAGDRSPAVLPARTPLGRLPDLPMSGHHRADNPPSVGKDAPVAHSDPTEPSEIDRALLALITETLAERPEGSATLHHRWVDEAGWDVEVQPREPRAAPFSVVFTDGDVLSVAVGNIWFEVYPVKSVGDLDYLRQIAAAVFAGRVEESTYKNKAWGRIYLDEGPVGVGSVHTLGQGATVQQRRYAPYS